MYSTVQLIRFMGRYIKPHKQVFWFATILRTFCDIIWLYTPYATAAVVDFFTHYKPGDSLTFIYVTISLVIVVTIIRHWGLYFAKISAFRLAERIELDAQHESLRHLMLLDMAWHEKENAGNKFKRIERGAFSLNRILKVWVNQVIEIFINFIGILFIFIRFDIRIGIALFGFMVTYYFLSTFYRKRAIAKSEIVNKKEEERSGLIFEAINNIRSVKVMSMSKKLLQLLRTNAVDLLTTIQERIFWFQFGNTIRNFYGQIFSIGCMIFIVYGIVHGHYEVSFLVLFTGYFNRIWASIGELTDITEDFAIQKISILRMREILDTPVIIDDEKGKVKFPAQWDTISFKDVSFSYQDKQVLHKLSFDIKRGEKVGIVGLSGAGKSTIFKLFLKEQESYNGEIRINNELLKDISKKDHFNHVAVVLQDTELFNASLRDNVTITNSAEENNRMLLDQALEISHVKDFVPKLPQGVETLIGEKGIKLSGGEKQRVGIARAIFKQPEILLLDEATSHLDLESEEKIQDSLHKFFKNVTAIVIAHRLTTIKEMDKIIVLENGKVVESGSFVELNKKKGRFAQLWEKQKL